MCLSRQVIEFMQWSGSRAYTPGIAWAHGVLGFEGLAVEGNHMDDAKKSLLSRWTAFRARRREKAQIRRQRANERAESPYRDHQPRGNHRDVLGGGDSGGI